MSNDSAVNVDLPTGLEQASALMAAYRCRAHVAGRSRSEAFVDRCEVQEAVALAHLRDMVLRGQAVALVVTPDVVDRLIDYATAEHLSRPERDEVADAVMNSAELGEIVDAAHAAVRELVAQHVEQTISRRSS